LGIPGLKRKPRVEFINIFLFIAVYRFYICLEKGVKDGVKKFMVAVIKTGPETPVYLMG
jgi:hypothetical protein